nr:MAG TPA: hypothetical protein [Caudoviricetes sp.]
MNYNNTRKEEKKKPSASPPTKARCRETPTTTGGLTRRPQNGCTNPAISRTL